MKIQNAVIITSDDQPIEMSLAELREFKGNVIFGWKPIDTAPRDGTQVLIYSPTPCTYNDVECFTTVAIFRDNRWCSAEYGAFDWHPTHWMPIPDGPDDPE